MITNPSDVEWVNSLEAWDKMPSWEKVPELDETKNLVPVYAQRYRAFELVKPEDVKVVILGQDPYPTYGHANGLAFSTNAHVKRLPGSLKNIFKEYVDDLGFPFPRNGDLTAWAERGVLLLNCALTTEEGVRGSHVDEWKEFTYETVRWLSRLSGRRVWLLWGRRGGEYKELIGKTKRAENIILNSTHPSPLSAKQSLNRTELPSFFGSKPFSFACDNLNLEKDFWKL